MAGRLEDKDMDQLEQWIGTGPKTFTLLYSITRDGCNATTFHQKCDNQGATVTVLYNQQNSIYGGYATQSWQSNNSYIQDGSSFLYQLNYNGSFVGRKFPCKIKTYSIQGNSGYGPTFGGGHDLNTFNGTINNSGGYFVLNGSMNIGHSYDNQGIQVNQINNGNMNVTELEVYRVADGKRAPKSEAKATPWRKTPVWNEKLLDNLTEDAVAFKPIPELKIPQARILMIGPVGAGKSSFYNTVNSIFKGRIANRACSGSAEQSLTTTYTQYEVRVRSGSTLNLRLCDTRGLEESQGLDILECNYLLDGNVPDFYQFNPASPITPDTAGFISRPSPGDKIHCVAFVIDATTLDVLPAKVLQKMKSFQTMMNQKGIPQSILLTKVDKLCKEVESDVSNVYRSKAVKEHVEKASQILGLPRGNVLPVKNYENEVQLEDNISILSLFALGQMLNAAEDFMENLYSRIKAEGRESSIQKLNIKD